jgi:hypothetical protein
MDIDSVPPTQDFKEYILNQVSEADVVLVVIGKSWKGSRDPNAGHYQIEQPNDWVRIEIEQALRSARPILPILVGGAEPPAESELPTSIRKLAFTQGLRVSSREDFNDHINRVIHTIESFAKKNWPFPKIHRPSKWTVVASSAVLTLVLFAGAAYWLFSQRHVETDASTTNTTDRCTAIRSVAGATPPADAWLENTRREAIKVFWITPIGNRVFYFELGPGTTRSVSTFVGHVWFATGVNDECLSTYKVSAGINRFTF